MAGGDERSLDDLGLSPGDKVRWQRKDGGHWHQGVVIKREPDGSVAVRDSDGAWRSILAERLEAQGRGRRGGLVWEPVSRRAARQAQAQAQAQLSLWS